MFLSVERKKEKYLSTENFPSDNTIIIQIHTLLTYKEKYDLKSVVPP